MAVAVVERFKQEVIYGLSAGTKKGGRFGEVAISGGSTVINAPIELKLQHPRPPPSRANPGHLTIFCAQEVGI